MFGKSRKPKSWTCRRLKTLASVDARQKLIPGWDQEKYSRTTGLVIGSGGIGGHIGEGLARKGLGTAHFCDGDSVEPTNLNRQLFVEGSLYKNKAEELCRILSKLGFLGTRLVAHPGWFQELDVRSINPNFYVVGVDNQLPETRLEVCRIAFKSETPAVIVAISRDADYGYCFVQEPKEACWACVFKPEMDNQQSKDDGRCPAVPAVIDTLKMLAGIALYAIDTLIMNRPRDWNYRVISLSRSDFGGSHFVRPRKGCPVCAGQERE